MIYSPLRYPGGKRSLIPLIKSHIEDISPKPDIFIEAFCGGSSIGLDLLLTNNVSRIVLNDLDKGIYSFWYGIINETDKFIQRIKDTPVTPEEWEHQKDILKNGNSGRGYDFDIGFATFYLNRTNRSGTINGGMIGGKKQDGKWKIDARFNKKNLIKRIEKIAEYKNRIEVYNLDAVELFKTHHWQNAFVYLDPPYYKKGNLVYTTSFTHEDHARLKAGVEEFITPYYDWILSYDNCDEITELYQGYAIAEQSMQYSITKLTTAKELLITRK